MKIVDPERTTVKKETELFNFAATPRKELGDILSFMYSPIASENFASIEKPRCKAPLG